jgi:hypothetical protein
MDLLASFGSKVPRSSGKEEGSWNMVGAEVIRLGRQQSIFLN